MITIGTFITVWAVTIIAFAVLAVVRSEALAENHER